MSFLKKNFHLIFLVSLLVLDAFIWSAVFREERKGELKVAFLDVGQGDAIFIEAPNGNQVLIDGGRGRQILSAISAVMPFYDRSIDVVLATHPDEDHIGGLPQILSGYKVDFVFLNGASSQTAAWRAFEEKIKEGGARQIVARREMRINLGSGAYFDILFPNSDISGIKDKNDGSIVGRLVYGDRSFMLTGDSPVKIENYLTVLDNKKLNSDVLKLGHHGSRTSSGENFLNFVSPEYAVISAGCDNSYGHPHKEILALLNKFKIPKISTCESGTIVFETDGENLSYKAEK